MAKKHKNILPPPAQQICGTCRHNFNGVCGGHPLQRCSCGMYTPLIHK